MCLCTRLVEFRNFFHTEQSNIDQVSFEHLESLVQLIRVSGSNPQQDVVAVFHRITLLERLKRTRKKLFTDLGYVKNSFIAVHVRINNA